MPEIPANEQEVKDEIRSKFLQRINGVQNCASVVIKRQDLPFGPRYDMRCFVDNSIKNVAQRKGFLYSEDSSEDSQLVFIMK